MKLGRRHLRILVSGGGIRAFDLILQLRRGQHLACRDLRAE